MKIARRRVPGSATSSAPCGLYFGKQPIALVRFTALGEVKQVGISRAGTLDDADAAQNRLPAARSVSVLSGPMSR